MIKTFKFLVTKISDVDVLYDTKRPQSPEDKKVKVATEQEIDDTVNKWLNDNPLIDIKDIKINVVEMLKHNNGGSNVNYMYYTIIYDRKVYGQQRNNIHV